MSENNGHKAGLRPAHGSYHIAYAEVGTSVAAGCDPANAALIADARTSLPLALDALEAVLAVLPEPGSVDMYGVAGALSLDVRDAIDTALAGGCPTVTAIDTALRAGS